MKGKTIKLLSVLLVAIMIITSTASVFAASFDDVKTKMEAHVDDIDSDKITTTGGGIVGILQVVAMVLAVIVLIVLGIKYMMGSAQEKAEYKKTFIPYIIGAILVFAAASLAGVVVNFANNIK